MAVRLCVRCKRALWRLPGWRGRAGTTERRLAPHRLREFSLLPELPDTIATITEKRKEFSDETVLGYSVEDVYNVVADVNNYKHFLPWCKDALYTKYSPPRSIVRLIIGFPPLTETYSALVLSKPPHSIRTISTDGRLFTHLENLWQFRPGPDTSTGPTCIINFWVYFEFRSILYARLGSVVFDEVARMMAKAFQKRCHDVYGPDHLHSSKASQKQLREKLEQDKHKNCHPLSRTPKPSPLS